MQASVSSIPSSAEPIRARVPEAQPHMPSGNLLSRREPSPVSEIADRPAKRETIKPGSDSLPAEIQRPTVQPLKTSAEREIERVVSRVEPTPLQPKPKTISRAEDSATEQTDVSLLKPRQRRTAQEEKRGDEGGRFNVSSRRLDATIQPRPELANRPMPQPIAPVVIQQQAQRSTSLVAEPFEDARPVINVVIGRVSVNAIVERTPAPARTPHPSGPSLSLDQYLKQRGGRS